MRKIILSLIMIFFGYLAFSQKSKIVIAKFSQSKPKIDGQLNDNAWKNVDTLDNFCQFEPYNDSSASESTYVKIVYDQNAIYISAECISNKNPIYNILTARDDAGQADYFGFYIDPYRTGTSGFAFFVTAAGVQIDYKIDDEKKNYAWDAVWYSSVVKTDNVFFVEMRIPYNAFRLPNKENQAWNVNFFRYIQNLRELDTWNHIDNSKTGELNQMGQIQGIHNISSPLNLSLIPSVSYYTQKYSNSPKKYQSWGFGTDIKYNINESFTLDMILVPDFSEIQSDDQTINLSPYEIYYNEKRYFFTEGTEIFNKGDIFYSRRIGKVPTLYSNVSAMLKDSEIVVSNPSYTQILNATKFSGKTNKGIGIGVMNAFTANTYAQILDTASGGARTILTEPFSNYNVLAFNIPLKNNSYTSFVNTNYSSFGRNYIANFTANETSFKNKQNSLAFFEELAVGEIFNDTNKVQTGFNYYWSVSKISGKFRFSVYQNVISKNYNPNDLGYLVKNNLITNSISFSYNIYKPFSYFLNWRNSIVFSQQSLYEKFKYIGTTITFNSNTKLKNNLSIGTTLVLTPDSVYDYFEPRAEDKYFIKLPSQSFRFWISTNYAKSLAYDYSGTFYSVTTNLHSQRGLDMLNSARIRISNNYLIVLSNQVRLDLNNLGYVGKSQTQDTIFFGKRNIKYITTTIEQNFILNKDISLYMKIRHYWSIVDYFEYFSLANSGFLYPLSNSYRFLTNQDVNYNVFTVDFNFTWIFMPGSQLSISYKKQITSSTTNIIFDYYDNFENMYFNFPRLDAITFKLLFYLDYNQILRKKLFTR